MSVYHFAFTGMFKVSFILLTGNGVMRANLTLARFEPRIVLSRQDKTTALKINLNQQVSMNRTF